MDISFFLQLYPAAQQALETGGDWEFLPTIGGVPFFERKGTRQWVRDEFNIGFKVQGGEVICTSLLISGDTLSVTIIETFPLGFYEAEFQMLIDDSYNSWLNYLRFVSTTGADPLHELSSKKRSDEIYLKTKATQLLINESRYIGTDISLCGEFGFPIKSTE